MVHPLNPWVAAELMRCRERDTAAAVAHAPLRGDARTDSNLRWTRLRPARKPTSHLLVPAGWWLRIRLRLPVRLWVWQR